MRGKCLEGAWGVRGKCGKLLPHAQLAAGLLLTSFLAVQMLRLVALSTSFVDIIINNLQLQLDTIQKAYEQQYVIHDTESDFEWECENIPEIEDTYMGGSSSESD